MIVFDEEFIENLSDNPGIAGIKIIDALLSFSQSLRNQDADPLDHYEEFLKALALLQAFAESHGIVLEYPELSSNRSQNINQIILFFTESRTAFDLGFTGAVMENYKKAFELKFGKAFPYEFSEGDLRRIQELINELRSLIAATSELDENYKQRILRRLEKMQSELHKKVSDLDRFWGLLVEGSIVLKKVGENAKPIVDRIKEIVDIVWRTQARAEELPSNAPLKLPAGDDKV